jgi:putative ABC transport system substrate-binding protein
MRRREFITLLSGAAAWPLAARAQQGERMRRIGVLLFGREGNPNALDYIAEFRQRLQELGWIEGRNLRIDVRFAGGDADRLRAYAAELVALAPDVLVGRGPAPRALQQATSTLPIVFTDTTDPVGGGLVASLARPGGNITGFAGEEYTTSSKQLELLKEIAPGVTRVAVIRDPTAPGQQARFGMVQGAANVLRVDVRPIDPRTADAIERDVAALARGPGGGLLVPPSSTANLHSDLIIGLAARHRLPAVYADRDWVVNGGLISYGPVLTGTSRLAAGYVDRILRGEKPADLSVQSPTKFEFVINRKTAAAIGLEIPPSMLARADEVIK